jgi:hypothetical protein
MAGAAGHLPAAGSTCEPPRSSALSNYVAGAAADAGSIPAASTCLPAEGHLLDRNDWSKGAAIEIVVTDASNVR